MAKLPEVAGLISDRLQLDPLFVQQHVRGLTEAGWLDGGPVTTEGAAGLLCAVLGTDPENATAVHGLPFVGACFMEADKPWIEAGSQEFSHINSAFPDVGSALTAFIDMIGNGTANAGQLQEITIAGRGKRLRALLVFDAVLFGGWARTYAWFGYEPIAELIPKISARTANVEVSHSIGSQVVADLAALMAQSESVSAGAEQTFRRELH